MNTSLLPHVAALSLLAATAVAQVPADSAIVLLDVPVQQNNLPPAFVLVDVLGRGHATVRNQSVFAERTSVSVDPTDASRVFYETIALNMDGKKLAILCDQCPFPSIRIPDTRFYIYDIDMDKFIDQKVNINRLPVEIYWDLTDPRLLAVETEYAKQESATDLNESMIDGTQKQVPLSQLKDAEIEDDFRKKTVEEFTGKTLETFFVTTDYGCKRQDMVKFE